MPSIMKQDAVTCQQLSVVAGVAALAADGFMSNLSRNLKIAREAKGLSQTDLARLIKCSQGLITAIESDQQQSTRYLIDFARALDVTPEWLMYGDGWDVRQKDAAQPPSKVLGETGSVLAPAPLAADQSRPARLVDSGVDIPIYGATEAQAPPFDMLISETPVEWIQRPAPLVGVPGAYGVYVPDDTMTPALRQGWVALVHPGRTPAKGDDVVVIYRSESDDAWRVMIRVFRQSAAGAVTLAQHHPAHDLAPIARNHIKSIHVIVATHTGG